MSALGPAATLGRLWAVASLTVKEAVRRKAFFVLILFAVAVISSMAFFPSVDPASKLRLIQVWSLRATVFFAALAAIFLGAFSIPSDYEQKRLYVLASKPISKITYLLGKYFGFTIIIAIFLGTMGLISVAYLRTVKLFGGSMIPELRSRPRAIPDGFEGAGSYEVNPQDANVLRVAGAAPGSFLFHFPQVDPGALGEPLFLRAKIVLRNQVSATWKTGSVRVDIRGLERPFQAPVRVEGDPGLAVAIPSRLLPSPRPLEVRISPGTADVVVCLRPEEVALSGSRATVAPRCRPEGYVDQDPDDPSRLRAFGAARGAFRWRFQKLDPKDFPDLIAARFRMAIAGESNITRFTATLRAVVETADGSLRHETDFFGQSNEWASLTFPRKILEAKQPLDVTVMPTDADVRLTARNDQMILFESNEPFEWNYFKGLGLMYGWILILMSVTLISSTFVSAPIAILLGTLTLLLGSIHSYIREGVRDIDRSISQVQEAEHHGRQARTPENLPPSVLKFSSVVSKGVLTVAPDADVFDFSPYLLNDLAVQAKTMRDALLAMLSRVAAVLLLGIGVMLFKDFG